MVTDTLPQIIEALTRNLAECVESSWAVALAATGSSLLPLYTFGHHPDLERCVAHVESELSRRITADGRIAAASWLPGMTCAIRAGEKLLAVLAFGPKKTYERFSKKDHALIERSAAHFSFLIGDERVPMRIAAEMKQLQRSAEDLASAREVQKRLLPQVLARIRGLDYYGECHCGNEVGGDFFDFIPIGRSSLLLSVGAVSGNGVAATIIMAAVQASGRMLGAKECSRLCEVIRELNLLVWQLSPENFHATMFYARIDASRRQMEYVDAGYGHAMLLRDNLARAEVLETTGSVLGLSTRTAYETKTLRVQPGDVLVAVTDGIVNATNEDGMPLAEQLVLDAVRRHPDDSSSELAGHIIRAVDHLIDAETAGDDRTVVVVRFDGASTEAHALPRDTFQLRERVMAHAVAC